MNYEAFNNLELIPQLFDLIEELKNTSTNSDKRWLSVKELSEYLTFGKDKIYKMVDVIFIEGEHYYRKENRLLFDKEKIDDWVLNTPEKLDFQSTIQIIDDVVASIKK
ncbi:helix-turn-helix domain-containing protein [Sulfurimonas microaerophilic]|uniref:helix-turn-helix domain-containing protein n=1 Tax=Sulfurimonas microaerophilic TaxID=3058392 RepID=UPI002715450F|nr:helix-turn-helix domain-containing protein [Sulfurimonas sp. hsl 1-7]